MAHGHDMSKAPLFLTEPFDNAERDYEQARREQEREWDRQRREDDLAFEEQMRQMENERWQRQLEHEREMREMEDEMRERQYEDYDYGMRESITLTKTASNHVGQRFDELMSEAGYKRRSINWEAAEEWMTILACIFIFCAVTYGVYVSNAAPVQ